MKNKALHYLWISILPAVLVGIAVAILNPGPQPIIGFITAFGLTALCAFFLAFACERLKINRLACWATAVSFAIRLVIGIILFAALPVYGYDEAPPNNGYLYLDGYARDTDAWQLASSGDSLLSAFQNEFRTDQYGGLLSLSAAVYRALSPDAHRPLLILILTSFFTSLGLPFLWKAVSSRWDEKAANASAWIYALYPESVILGASQMREPILIGLSAITFWGVAEWGSSRKNSILALCLSAAGMVFISLKAAAAILLGMVIWFWLENILPHVDKKWRTLTTLLLVLVIAAGLFLSWGWLVDSSKWDLYLMESSSGRIQWEVELIGEKYRAPFIIGYGSAQPVLPAAIVYPGIPITRAISIFRALGWYLLVPLMFSGFLLIWKNQHRENKTVFLLFFILALVWTFVSSARAGGDQWDNPRYRSLFLVWMVFLAGWSWVETLRRRSPWLWRMLLLEVVYIAFFIQWYLSRYYDLFKRMNFWPMVRLLGIIGAAIIFGGLIFDLIYNKIRKKTT
ncbi:MAG: hypothetical protein Q8N39_09685 [Pelolinea sp.]|nr:hypothetical protein [Pelolinea sp.]